MRTETSRQTGRLPPSTSQMHGHSLQSNISTSASELVTTSPGNYELWSVADTTTRTYCHGQQETICLKNCKFSSVLSFHDCSTIHMSAAAPSVVTPSLLLVLKPVIHCLTICAIQLLGQISFDGIWNPPFACI